MKKILIVDDDEIILEFMRSILTKHGYRVLVAAKGKDAIEIARSEDPDLVIIDINLPDVSGTYVAKALSDDPAMQRIPYFFLTGLMSREDETLLRNTLGGNFFLAKPCNTTRLLEAIEKMIR